MKVFAALAVLFAVAYAQEETCPEVNPVRNFKYSEFEGQWFEIGHYRNSGPSIWSEQCFCSTSNVTQDWLGEAEGDSVYSYVCDIEQANGDIQAFDSTLFGMSPPGKWQQSVVPGFEAQTLTVLDLDNDHALAYRCGLYENVGLSYTVQFLSRSNSLDAATIAKFQAKVTELKLNPEGAKYETVSHEGCSYEGH